MGEDRFFAFGETRFTTGTMYTDKLYTGQREITGLGIYHYGARFYSPKLGRFLSADTIVPGYANPQNLNRFSYVTNNPLRYIDPTGHRRCESDSESCESEKQVTKRYKAKQEKIKEKSKKNKEKDNLGGGGHPLLSTTPPEGSTYSTPLLPPSPFACGWFDCALSAASAIASVFTLDPATLVPAFIVDGVVTGIAYFHTQDDYHQGEISQIRQWALNGTGLLGLVPGDFGLALSLANLFMTLTGIPE